MYYGHDGIIEPIKLDVVKKMKEDGSFELFKSKDELTGRKGEMLFVYYKNLFDCVKKELDGIEELNVEIKSRDVKKVSDLTPQETQLADYINSIIKKMVGYGVHEETVKNPSLFLSWSNGGECWCSMGRVIPKLQETIKIDANEFLIPLNLLKNGNFDDTHRAILTVLPFLDYLPLFGNSFESKVRSAGLDKIKGSGFEYLHIEKEPVKW
jgi:hypothetical protein